MENTAINKVIYQDTACLHCGNLFHGSGSFCCHACETLYDLEIGSTDYNQQASKNHFSKFSYLDQTEFQTPYRRPQNEFVFFVQGLECTSCVHLLEKLPEIDPSILSASLHFGDNTLRVRLDDGASLAKVMCLIEEMGYHGTPITENEDTEEHHKNENRNMLIRIAVAGACAGNMMLFVIPIYSGLAGAWAHIFNWICFALFLPVVGFCALPFYRGAWTSLKYKHLSVDLPITIALASTFIYSTWNLLTGRDQMYFDSTASFMFLILSSRYLVKRLQQKALQDNVLSGFSPDQGFTVFEDHQWTLIPSKKIQIGHKVKLSNEQILSFDGILLSEKAEFDSSLLTGESVPALYAKSMLVPAGSKSLAEVEVQVCRLSEQTEIGKMLKSIQQESLRQTPFVGLTDKLSQALIATVISAATIYFILNYQQNFEVALSRALSLFIIACPCALALGTPLTFALALRKSKDLGILIRSPEVFEKLPKIQNIILDKTGTVTEGHISFVKAEPELTPQQISLVLGLESESQHSIARSLRAAFVQAEYAELTNRQEIAGHGVTAYQASNKYELTRSSSQNSEFILLDLKQDGKLLSRLFLVDKIHADSKNEIRQLQNSGYKIMMASGDSVERTNKIAAEVNIDPSHVLGKMTAEQKQMLIKNLGHCLMVGDGANDSLALQSADVGAAMMGSVSLALSTADVHFVRNGLTPLHQLLLLGKKAHSTLVRNLSLSLIYNITAGSAALFGLINPFVAAVLMPISSAVIAFSTWWGLR